MQLGVGNPVGPEAKEFGGRFPKILSKNATLHCTNFNVIAEGAELMDVNKVYSLLSRSRPSLIMHRTGVKTDLILSGS